MERIKKQSSCMCSGRWEAAAIKQSSIFPSDLISEIWARKKKVEKVIWVSIIFWNWMRVCVHILKKYLLAFLAWQERTGLHSLQSNNKKKDGNHEVNVGQRLKRACYKTQFLCHFIHLCHTSPCLNTLTCVYDPLN